MGRAAGALVAPRRPGIGPRGTCSLLTVPRGRGNPRPLRRGRVLLRREPSSSGHPRGEPPGVRRVGAPDLVHIRTAASSPTGPAPGLRKKGENARTGSVERGRKWAATADTEKTHLLRVRGNPELMTLPATAFRVRERRPRRRSLTEDCARQAVAAGFPVISAHPARVELAAHRAGLAQGGRRILVRAEGIERFRIRKDLEPFRDRLILPGR